MKQNRDRMETTGKVTQAYRGGFFDVILNDSGSKVYASICGKMRKTFIKVVPGDEVIVEISPFDLSKGRIIRRLKGEK